jgi:MGT family glycosyltransferase
MTGDRRHFAFLPYPAFGHMMPVLPVMAELVRRGHRVTCFTSAQFADRLAVTGAEMCVYDPPLSTEPPPDFIGAETNALAALALLKTSAAVLPAIEERFGGDLPDAVVYDSTLWFTGRLVAREWRCPSIQLTATFCSNGSYSLGDHYQDVSEQVDPQHPAVLEFAACFEETLAAHGLAEIDKGEFFAGSDEFTVVFLPREFQFAGDTFDERYEFVGPTINEHAEPGWTKPPGDLPVLLVSLGTTVNNHPEFFRDCVRAFGELPWHTVLTLGSRVHPDELGELPPNVEAHQWIPLGAVLRHARVFLSQAGMGSVMEALYYGVPMVAVPHHPEQSINSHRLLELGIGYEVAKHDVTPEALREAVLAVAGDELMAGRAAAMGKYVRASGGAVRAADVLEGRVAVEAR